MRTKKIGDQSPLRVPAVSAKKIATLPFLIASLKSKGRLMIAKICLSSEGTIVVKEGRIGKRLIHRKYGAPIGPRSKQRLRSVRPRDMYR